MFDRGDLIWVDFVPSSGHEQAGRRAAMVLSPKAYNSRTGLLIACAMTTKIKGYPFEVNLTTKGKSGPSVSAVLADQVRVLDWKRRKADKFASAPAAVVEEVAAKLKTLLP